MTTLVVPDIHNHWREAEAQISRYPTDRIVFLGDYFDSIGDSPRIAAETADWLKASLQMPDRTHLMGNHDAWYRFPNHPEICYQGDGFTPEKLKAINKKMKRADWDQLKLVDFVGGIALSHAGIEPSVFADPVDGISPEVVKKRCELALQKAESGLDDLVWSDKGINWLRWWAMPLLSEFSQIVGHTVSRELRTLENSERFNICIDTMGRYLARIDETRKVIEILDDVENGEVVFTCSL